MSALLLPVATFEDAFRVLGGAESRLGSWAGLSMASEAMANFRSGLGALLRASHRHGGLAAYSDGPLLESEVLRLLVDAVLGHGAEPLVTCHTRRHLVQRAVAYMHDRLEVPLTAFELCEVLQVSDRALRRAFRESFGMGPLAYFRVMRLHAVRGELLRKRDSGVSIADVARRWNFNRLGPLAGAYDQHFGELPSATLGLRGSRGVRRITRRARSR